MLEANKPRNAVILAAGHGLRMIPINQDVPKGLIEIKGETLIERLIKQLHEAGITEIDIVVGYMNEAYEYLKDIYNVNIVYNPDYELKNNLFSLQKVDDKISNTYIVPCDVYCENNPFSDKELHSWYAVTDMVSDESDVRINRKHELITVDSNQSGNAVLGIAYITAEDAVKLVYNMKKLYETSVDINDYWEKALIDNDKYFIAARIMNSENVFEINTYEDLRELDDRSNNLTTYILLKIADVLKCNVEDIKNIACMKKGMSNNSFMFECKGKRYVMRIPGVGTDKLVNRKQEGDVYEIVTPYNISDPVIWFDKEVGYKLSEYIENNRMPDPSDKNDIRLCMQTLRKFHSYKLKVDHKFDLYDRIQFYEECWEGKKSEFEDYLTTKAHLFELKDFINAQPKELQLCHVDTYAENFLVAMDNEGNDVEVRMIDWEYAGMNDPDADIASWVLYALYEKEETDELIDMYYPEGIDIKKRIKIYCYAALYGLAWSNWCEYKKQHGVDYGDYALGQYRMAKKYYEIAKEAIDALN